MDGNGRWAKAKGQHRIAGHHQGVKSVREITEAAAELGVEHLTLYTFSTENWHRPRLEVEALMHLLVATIRKETKTLIKNNVRLSAMGQIDTLPKLARRELEESIQATAANTGLQLHLALSYSARWEIIEAVRKLALDVASNKLDALAVDEHAFRQYLACPEVPDPELLIRTSGELRLSNFMLWQIAYTELYFTDKLWPDFDKDELYTAILEYQTRDRRFGKVADNQAASHGIPPIL